MLAHRSHGLNSKAMEEALAHNAFFLVPTQFVIYLAIVGLHGVSGLGPARTSLLRAIQWNLPGRRRALNALMAGAALALVSDIGEIVLHRVDSQIAPHH